MYFEGAPQAFAVMPTLEPRLKARNVVHAPSVPRRDSSRRLRFCVAAALIAVPAFAQVSASLSGRVLDPSGAAISQATVTVKSLETGATRTAATNESGDYRITSLPLGLQEIRVEKQPFKTQVRSGVALVVGQEAVVNFTLQIGDIIDSVTVTEDASVVNTTTAPTSGVVGAGEVKDLPLNGRSYDNLITLNPGAIDYSLKSANT